MSRRPPRIDTLPPLPAAIAGGALGAGVGAGLLVAGEPWLTLAAGVAVVGTGVGLGITGRPWIVGDMEVGATPRRTGAIADHTSPFPFPIRADPILGEVVELPGGEFWMGTADADPRGYHDERPRHRVRVGPMSVGRTPVTVGQWNMVFPEDRREGAENLPITSVSWGHALRFCAAASERTRVAPAWKGNFDDARTFGPGYRLPTEAEWEYVCRAGTDTAWAFGDDETLLHEHAWYQDNAGGRVQPVAGRRPNRWGLCDLHGNVWEWCADSYDTYGLQAAVGRDRVNMAVDNPLVVGGSWRVLRGGGGINTSMLTRSASRGQGFALSRNALLGFRCVLAPCSTLSIFDT